MEAKRIDLVKNEIKDAEGYLKLIVKNVILNFKFLFSNISSIFLFCSFSILPVIVTIIFIPFFIVGPLIFQYSCIIPIMLAYGALTYAFRSSTLYKNLQITKNSNITFYFASFITVSVLGIFLFFLSFFLFFICDQLLLLQDAWMSNSHNPESVTFWPIQWIDVFYSLFVCLILSFVFSYFLASFLFDKKSYYVIVLIVMLLSIIFGGTINDYFTGGGLGQQNYEATLFPNSMFYPTAIFFPFYSVGQTSSIITSQMRDAAHDGIKILNEFQQSSFKWNLLLVMPYIHILVFGFLGKIISSKLKR